jgi:hypothetical protein
MNVRFMKKPGHFCRAFEQALGTPKKAARPKDQ